MSVTDDKRFMRLALELAEKGKGFVEPNPMVGCVLVQNGQVVGQGYHTQYGKAHAEIEALRNAAGDLTGATCYVTLEPCSHHGKTPPCVEAILKTGISRIVTAMSDPNPLVNGKGLQMLRESGRIVTENILRKEAEYLNAPYLTLLQKSRPWVHAKWAMTLDGKLAAKTGDSQWISGEKSRKVVHQLRSRMDAVLVGAGTVRHDDPMLTVRISEQERWGNKVPVRVVLNSSGDISPMSQLVQTAKKIPVLVVVNTITADRKKILEQYGCEVLVLEQNGQDGFCQRLLENFALRKWTHLLLEGGSKIFGTFFDAQCIDEAHAFAAPKLLGGSTPSVIGGRGIESVSGAAVLDLPKTRLLDSDFYICGRIQYKDK